MNAVERSLLATMENAKFQNAVKDDFTFVDSLVEQSDLDKIKDKEAKKDARND